MRNKFIKSTIILLIGGLVTKILGLVIKIITTRLIGTKGISMYMLILPTLNLVITLATISTPTAMSKLISEDTRNNKRLFISILPILFIFNLLIIIVVVISSKYISINLLKNKDLYPSILSISLVIPFTTTSALIRSYFFGKMNLFPHVLSNIVENIIRILLIVIGIPRIHSLKYSITYIVLCNIISEVASTITLMYFLPKNISFKREDFKLNYEYLKDTLKICIPNTLSNLIGSISYFLEPIILIKFLSKFYPLSYITREYGIISGYVLPLLLLPSFFTLAISQVLLPLISKEYTKGNIRYVKNKINITLILTLLFSLVLVGIFILYGDILLKVIYKTSLGITYLKVLAPIISIQYLQAPLSFCLEAIGKSKINFIGSIISIFIRVVFLIILSNFKIGIYSFIISLGLNILITTGYLYYKLKKYVKIS